LRVEARSLTDGRALLEKVVPLSLEPGERRVALELDISDFDAKSTLVYAELFGKGTFRLLAEPKDSELSVPKLDASIEGSELVLRSDLPVVDLYLWDDEGDVAFSENFVTLNSGACRRVRMHGAPVRLRARSLAGEHLLRLA
ncbi:MAG TPA: hypothetical protein VFQ35_06655, partial [Polyangiaceae bacterium]|nr:hypothetical protein [Polyangiaceae bacterium]